MKRLASIARNFVKEDEGAALLEYGMLVLLIAVLCIVAIRSIGSKVSNGFNTVTWRDGDVVYTLVTDLNDDDIRQMLPSRQLPVPVLIAPAPGGSSGPQVQPASFQP